MGLIQNAIEDAGISTISIAHLANLTKKIRVPRALHLAFPMGRSYGKAFDTTMHQQILLDCLRYITQIREPETIVKLPYRWKR